MSEMRAIRGRLVDTPADPGRTPAKSAIRVIEDGLLVIENGRIRERGPAGALLERLPEGVLVDHWPDGLVLPGFIDAHIHYPQTAIIASYGAQLLEWLERYTFPEEARFADPDYAHRTAGVFMDQLLRNGTTAAAVYGTVHPGSVDAIFARARAAGMRLVAGKVMMDRGAPMELLDSPVEGYRQSKALIERWHGVDRLGYAITPRFAVTSSAEQLSMAGTLLREHPDCWLQTHLAENHDEIRTVRDLFPEAASYTAVYETFGLLGPRSLFGHCLHLGDDEVAMLARTGSIAVFCPTSNLFIGSGLFDKARLEGHTPPVRTALASDVGGGTSFSMLRTAAEGYKVLHLRGQRWPAAAMLWSMTAGNAAALGLEDEIGRLEPGLMADVTVLAAEPGSALAWRLAATTTIEEALFAIITMGGEECVRATYVAGRKLFERGSEA